MTIAEQLRSFARLVAAMRQKQNDYFRKGRSSDDLADSKQLEREVDGLVSEILAGPSLFGDRAEDNHRRRNDVAVFASATETIRTLIRSGRVDISAYPRLELMLEECHAEVERMGVRPEERVRPA